MQRSFFNNYLYAVKFDLETFYEALYNNLSKHLQGECVWGLGNYNKHFYFLLENLFWQPELRALGFD